MKLFEQLSFSLCIIAILNLSACTKKDNNDNSPNVEGETWVKTFGGINDEIGSAVCQTADGGYVIAGLTSSNNTGDMGTNKGENDVCIIRTDANGKKLWVKTYGGAAPDDAGSITATPDGGFVIEGTTNSNNSGDVGPNHGGDDIWLLKVDANGKLVWQKTLGGSLSEWKGNVINTPDGGLILTGYTASAGTGDVTTSHGPGGADAWIVKLDANGKLLWQKAYGGIGFDYGYGIAGSADGGYVIAGGTWNSKDGDVNGVNHGQQDTWVIKIDANGTLLWQKLFGGAMDEVARYITRCADGGFAIAGYTESNSTGDVGPNHGQEDIWVIRIDANGNLQWQKTIGGAGSDTPFGMVNSSDGGFIIGANTSSSNSGDVGPAPNPYQNMWIAKLSANGTLTAQQFPPSGDGSGSANALINGPNGSLILAGQGNSISNPTYPNHSGSEAWIVKTKEP